MKIRLFFGVTLLASISLFSQKSQARPLDVEIYRNAIRDGISQRIRYCELGAIAHPNVTDGKEPQSIKTRHYKFVADYDELNYSYFGFLNLEVDLFEVEIHVVNENLMRACAMEALNQAGLFLYDLTNNGYEVRLQSQRKLRYYAATDYNLTTHYPAFAIHSLLHIRQLCDRRQYLIRAEKILADSEGFSSSTKLQGQEACDMFQELTWFHWRSFDEKKGLGKPYRDRSYNAHSPYEFVGTNDPEKIIELARRDSFYKPQFSLSIEKRNTQPAANK
ncbi:MAG: hypothetical protein AB1540_04310 [Bdellovibrionota bacterium]